MRVEAVFSEGMTQLLDGAAIGDEFVVSARARIIGAEEALVDVSQMGEGDPIYVQGQLEVKLLLSHPLRTDRIDDGTPQPGDNTVLGR